MKSNYTIQYASAALHNTIQTPVPQRVWRNITVEQRTYNLIREEELVSKKPYSGCRICKNGKICGPCRLVEAFKLARNHPKVWHDIIYKDEDQTSAASQRRRSKLKKATGRGTTYGGGSMITREAICGTCGGEHMCRSHG